MSPRRLLAILRFLLRLLRLPPGLYQRLFERFRALLSHVGRAFLLPWTQPPTRQDGRRRDENPDIGSSSDHSLPATEDAAVVISASSIPLDVVEAGLSRVHPLAHRGSSSYPNLQQTLAPIQSNAQSPRARAMTLPLPATLDTAGRGLHDNAEARTESIEVASIKDQDFELLRAPNDSHSAQSQLSLRQLLSQPDSQSPTTSSAAQDSSPIAGSNTSIEMFVTPSSSLQSRSSLSLTASTLPYSYDSCVHHRGSIKECVTAAGDTGTPVLSGYSYQTARDSISTSNPQTSYPPIDTGTHMPSEIVEGSSSQPNNVLPGFRTWTSSNSAPLPAAPEGRYLVATTPLETHRYNSRPVSEETPSFTVPAFCFTFSHSAHGQDIDLRGWEPRTHTEGALYFYHPKKRAFTEANLYQQIYLEEVEVFINFLEGTLEAMPGEQLPDDYELGVRISFGTSDTEQIIRWEYYYVNHSTGGLFWLFPFEVDAYLNEVSGQMSPAHFKHLLESWYWDHVSIFPDNFRSHDSLVESLVGQLTFFYIDQITSSESTVVYPAEELSAMIGVLSRKEPGDGTAHVAAALGRMMSIICHWRYTDYHGSLHARLDRLNSVHGSSRRSRSWFMTVFSFVLISAPENHLQSIEKVYVDDRLPGYLWKRHVDKLQAEWADFVLYSTVMLAANVSMLSVPDVILLPDNNVTSGADSGDQNYVPPLRSPAAIASYISTLLSVGSIVLGLALIRTHRTKNHHNNSYEAVAFMQQQKSRIFHHEPLAILYSLPYALLLWSMISFLAGFLIFTLNHTDTATQSTVAALFFVVSCLVAWCSIAIWEVSEHTQEKWGTLKQAMLSRDRDVKKAMTSMSEAIAGLAGWWPELRAWICDMPP
ncbi:hypothetical protein PENSPDRAFT_651869 [Peniophora sp. CONT]|nr:hypothetical protein PENSPDRAFT_651869 [Peniophora sp. CONT]